MFVKEYQENKINFLRNDLETNYKILTGEVPIERLNVDDLVEIIGYGWDRNDLQRMLDSHDYRGVGVLAAWIRECGSCDHGMMVEDDPYFYPLDEEGNYLDGAFGRCC